MKKRLINILLVIIFLIGLSLLLYPTFSDYWNSFHQSRAIASYAETVAQLDNEEYDKIWEAAKEYNRKLRQKASTLALTEEQLEEYNSQLNIGGDGVMGYIEIPSIDVHLPVYHGTEESVLQVAVGHIEGTSLPTGGIGTHAVFSGHRGLPSAKLFTDLDELIVGDTFIFHILDETLTYEVDQILIVEPQEIDELMIDPEKDLCTLVTCTPYGINSHRLLVRGHRVENEEEAQELRVTADAMRIEPVVVAPLIAVPILLVLFLWLMVKYRKPKNRKKKHREGQNDEAK